MPEMDGYILTTEIKKKLQSLNEDIS